MSFEVIIEASPLFEIVSSINVFVNKSRYYEYGEDWRKGISKQLPAELKETLENDKAWLSNIGLISLLITKSPVKHDVLEFVSWLENLSDGQMYEILAPYFIDGLPGGLHQFRERTIFVFRAWNDSYPLQENWIEALNSAADRMRGLSEKQNPKDLVEEATNGIRVEPVERLDTVILVPSLHMAPMNLVFCLNKTMIILCGTDLEPQDFNHPSAKLTRMTKAIADENRLRILQIISAAPLSFSEISERANLSKSNLHYHLMLLRTGGFLSIINQYPLANDKYTLRQSFSSNLQNQLERYIKSRS